MKKTILIFCAALTTLCLSAFGYKHWSNTVTNQEATTCSKIVVLDNDLFNVFNTQANADFFYAIGSRFGASITKENLHKAKSVIDIIPKEAGWSKYPIQTVKVTILHDGTETSETGDNLALNKAQAQLLRSTDYSDNFCITASRKGKHKDAGDREYYDLAYYLTVTPEKEAEYTGGEDALIDYLKENSKGETAIVKQDQLKSGKVSFTVTKDGAIANVKLSSTSGYSTIDKAMVNLITTLPGTWNPATNQKGEKVDQEFVFSFGQAGC